MSELLSEATLDQLFRSARTFNAWLPKEVSDEQLHRIYELAKFGPTSANSSPMRIVFVKSKEAKARLGPFLCEGNRAMTMEALVNDTASTEIYTAAFRNATLQGAYLLLAARAVGLDCGPMSGFDNAGVDAAFFAGTAIKSNFLISIGYGDASRNLFPRSPRLAFDEACKIA
jgi:3-hydroxypropanoate dehydrogenase